MGASANADRAGGLRPEPPAESQPKALIPSAADLISMLEYRIQQQRLRGGDMLYCGEPHPLDLALLAFLRALAA